MKNFSTWPHFHLSPIPAQGPFGIHRHMLPFALDSGVRRTRTIESNHAAGAAPPRIRGRGIYDRLILGLFGSVWPMKRKLEGMVEG